VHADEQEILASFSLTPKKYILLILGDRNEKGAWRACKALLKIFENEISPELKNIKILIAGISYTRPYLKITKNNSHFIFSNYIQPEILEVLYKNAHLFMYPTLNEGFGSPPLEAMKYGTICACSANSAITEVCGDAVLYFNPFDDIEIGIRILQSFDETIRFEKDQKMKTRMNYIIEKQTQDLKFLTQLILGEKP
jgi:hypothetical protein